MIRKYFSKFKESDKEKIAWRSHEPTRIEAFSDAVFAFAVSLLVFSLEVPKNSEELLKGMGAFFPFTFCFIIIFFIWYTQYKFFRHYGMHDTITIALNAALMITVLGYMYPLKFMVSGWMMHGTEHAVRLQDVLPLVIIYNAGFIVIYLLFTLMYVNAYLKRAMLKLTPEESFETVTYIYQNIALASVGAVVIIAAIILYNIDVQLTFSSFIFYVLPGILFSILGVKRKKAYKKKFGDKPVAEPELGLE